MATAESLSNFFEEYGFELTADIIAKCMFEHKSIDKFASN